MERHAMKKITLLAIVLAASLLTAQAQFFTNGNLAVVRISGILIPPAALVPQSLSINTLLMAC